MKKKRMINKAAGDMNTQAPNLVRSRARKEDADVFSERSIGERGYVPPLSVPFSTLIR
jgi:hypothetical protein